MALPISQAVFVSHRIELDEAAWKNNIHCACNELLNHFFQACKSMWSSLKTADAKFRALHSNSVWKSVMEKKKKKKQKREEERCIYLVKRHNISFFFIVLKWVCGFYSAVYLLWFEKKKCQIFTLKGNFTVRATENRRCKIKNHNNSSTMILYINNGFLMVILLVILGMSPIIRQGHSDILDAYNRHPRMKKRSTSKILYNL